jgi:integrase
MIVTLHERGLIARVLHNVSKRLGHKSVTMTSEIYAHLLPNSGRQMATTMGAILHG